MNPIDKNDHLIYDFYGQGQTELESCMSLYKILLCAGYKSITMGKILDQPKEKDHMFISYRGLIYLICIREYVCPNKNVFYLSYLVKTDNLSEIKIIPYKGTIEKEKKD